MKKIRSDRYELYVLFFPNSKVYAGISYDTASRFEDHKRNATTGVTYPVYAAMRKYGIDNVKPVLVVVGHKSYIKQLEIDYIRQFQLRDRRYGYNLAVGGDISMMHSPEIAAKVSATKRRQFAEDPTLAHVTSARMHSPEASAKRLLTIRTPEVRAKKSAKLLGTKHTEQARANMRAAQNAPGAKEARSIKVRQTWAAPEKRAQHKAHMRGIPIPPEHRAKISATLMGHPGFGKGVPRTDEIRAKISASKLGHTVSEETREKIRQANLRYRRALVAEPV